MSVEDKDKLVSIIIDEMSTKKLISYNSKNDLFSGFEDFADNSIVDLKNIKYCDQALVVMIKGLTTFSNDDEIYSWQDLVTFYNLDKNKTLRLAPKLKNIHMDLPPFSPMRVCLATQTLSHTVSSGILTLVALNKMRSKATYTAKCISFFDSLFDIFNSITYNEPKILRRPLTKDSCHWEFLKNSDKFLNNLKIYNKSGKQPPCIKRWRENINALELLFEKLNTENSIEFLLTRILTQDYIENVFFMIRAKGGNNTTPDATKFQSAMRMFMCNNSLTPSKEGNCEMDASQFLTKLNEIKTIKLQVNSFNTRDNTIENDKDTYNNRLDVHLSSTNINSILMDPHNSSAVTYVTGWACSKLEHPECINQLAAKNKSNTSVFNPCTTFIEMKKYENSDLLYPFDSTIDFCKRMTCLFKKNIQKMLFESKANVRSKIINLIQTVCIRTINICNTCKLKFIKKCINVLINS